MTEIHLPLSEELLMALSTDEEAAADQLRMAAAVKLYELGRLSSGAAAELAGLPKPVFLSRLGAYGVPHFQLTEEELREDLSHA
jgi:predicted HTH domain antitoxin